MAVSWITADDLVYPEDPHAPAAAESASWILYKLSAEKYGGLRTATEWYGLPGLDAGCGVCGGVLEIATYDSLAHAHIYIDVDADSRPRGVRLRGRPVRAVSSLTDRDGAEIPSASYSVVNSAYLVNTDRSRWNMRDGFTVAYSFGMLPPEIGRQAAIRLANELLYLAVEPEKCQLPDRVSSVNRQGISFTILDPQDFLKDGRTGVYEIDLFLQAANPSKAKKRPRVFSPDIPRGER